MPEGWVPSSVNQARIDPALAMRVARLSRHLPASYMSPQAQVGPLAQDRMLQDDLLGA